MSIVKPIKVNDDDEDVQFTREFDVDDDLIAAKGIAFQGQAGVLIEEDGDGDLYFQDTVTTNPEKLRIQKQNIQFQFVGQMNFDQYLYSWQHDGNANDRSGDPSNGWQFANSSPILCPFNGTVKQATFRNRGVAQSTGTPAANMTLLYELWRVGVTGGEGTKLGDVSVTFATAGKTIGNWWNSAVNTDLNETNDSLDIAVSRGDLLGLKFIRVTGASNVVSVHNALVNLYLEED